ncbi:MAG: arginase family protein [Nanoarchaeota archaeon]|nr:arginase family protein [Nanoarchaeota archaeon]
MDLPEEYSGSRSYFAVIPRPVEGNVSYGKGACKGPNEIINASAHLEYYDEQCDQEPFTKGIITTDKFKADQFPIFLGGDHSITINTVKDVEKYHDDFSIIILDAHPDCFHSWNGSTENHRCTTQRVSDKHKTLVVGVRSMDLDEVDIINNNKNIGLIKAYDYNEDIFKQKLSSLKEKVYISIDVDVFDPSFIRNTGTPEPGGFSWDQIISLLNIIFNNKNVIASDIVEFAPTENFRAEAYSLAKLAYKIMSLKNSKQ